MIIKIHEKKNVYDISLKDWQSLATKAQVKNPFYEHWNLIPALKWMDVDEAIKIVTVHENEKLIGLFPIQIKVQSIFFRLLSVWGHAHCFLTMPLASKPLDWNEVFSFLFKQLNAHALFFRHHRLSFLDDKVKHYTVKYARAAMYKIPSWEEYEKALPGKKRKEYRRILKRINGLGNVEFKTNVTQDLEKQMAAFIDLEGKGWKGEEGGALKNHKNEANYYYEMAKNSENKGNIIFDLCLMDGELLSISMAFFSNGHMFKIKTTFDEDFRSYSPSIATELNNIKNIYAMSSVIDIDSCTSSNNTFASNLFPEKKELSMTWVYKSTLVYQLVSACRRLKRKCKLIKEWTFDKNYISCL